MLGKPGSRTLLIASVAKRVARPALLSQHALINFSTLCRCRLAVYGRSAEGTVPVNSSIKGVLMRSCLPWRQEHRSALEQRPGRCPTATHTTPACQQQQQQQQRPQQLMHPTPCRQQHHQPQRCQARCSHSSSSSWLHHQAAPAGCISNACPSKLRTKGWGRTISSKIRVPMLQASSWAQSLKAGRTCKLAHALLDTYVAMGASCRTCERAKSDCQ